MNYATIKWTDIANGEGIRVSLFVSGCTNHCKECFNPETWNFEYGKPFTEETERYILDNLKSDFVNGLTLLGGEPFEPENQVELVKFVRKVKELHPKKDIWAFTGYIYDKDLVEGGRKYCEATDELLSMLDVLVDGPFIAEQKNLMLKFRGSSNQRVLNMQETLKTGEIVLFMD